jgi:glycosyltransferase involved in cell wall biosynthesis
MPKFSAVIICKNEEQHIAALLQNLQKVTDDIVVLDNGSTDRTREIVSGTTARLILGKWLGYGKTKNTAVLQAKYDWILSLDADELLDDNLKKFLSQAHFQNDTDVIVVRFKNFLGNKRLKHGEWGNDKHIRVYNRNKVKWDEEAVHEKLVLPADVNKRFADGYILHYTAKNIADYSEKMVRYALLNAEKYATSGKKSSVLKVFFSPVFSFLKYYFFQLGFLDGWHGLVCASMTAYYTFIKYARLLEINKSE